MDQIPPTVQGTLFVDDHAIYCSAPTALEAGRKIQATINAVTKWADRRGFKFSPQKTKAIRFTRCRKREEIPTLFLKGVILPYESEVKFLGVIFDKGLTFVTHVNDLCVRVRQSNILKVVSHYDWGADRATLLRLYKTLCLSKIDYACQIYGSAARTTFEKLDVHNLGLRICTGAYRTSPVDSLYVDSGVPPLSLRREELGLRYLAKCLTSKDNSNFKFVMNPYDISPNRPRIPKPLEVRLEKESREIGLYDSTIAKLGPTKYPPWCKPPVEICICTGGKQHHDPQAVKAQFLEHSSKHNTSISVYTDGSKSKQGVGSAAVFNGKIIKRKLPSLCSNFTAEAYAILLAVKEIYYSCSNEQSFIIYTDSNSVLASLRQLLPTHPLVQEVQDWLVLLHSRKRTKVNFCWVPGHTGVMGNETADKASKSAVADLQPTTAVHIPHGDLKEIIHTHIQNKWQHRWSTLTDNLKLKKIRPFIKKWESSNCPNRRNSIILTRLRIGHTHLTHSFLMTGGDERQVPFCRTCQAHITVQHFLTECICFQRERRANHSFPKVKGDQLKVLGIIGNDILQNFQQFSIERVPLYGSPSCKTLDYEEVYLLSKKYGRVERIRIMVVHMTAT
ncbi:uncharacterized protein LOC143028389 [Oratosquilla oratoria]|uniref:uncharacterized protein LOC143028389 n=1 Tax=Oratosquilla oratoria TaxID=337810 RepID=UPI003F762777